MSTNSIATQTNTSSRLAINNNALAELGLDLNTWQVLTDSIFPSAKTAEGILLAVRYCQARGLDVLKRPVAVVPMWSKALGREVETIWPGINEVQITATRTGQYAGLDPARFGPDLTRVFAGRARTDNGWKEVQVEVTYPEWAEVTVYRLVGSQRCPFSETVFWDEAYSRAGGAGTEVPNVMWIKRPRGQLLKCAKAASLRAAFPEEASDYTAEEMTDKTIGPEELVVNRNVAWLEAKPSIAPEAVEQIGTLVKRAARSRAWASATEYFQRRFQGADLAYALGELDRAEREANVEAQAA